MKEKQKNQSMTASSPKPAAAEHECPECGDREFILDMQANTAKPCKCREQKQIRRLIKSSGLTEQQRQVSFESLNPDSSNRDMYRLCREYLDNFANIVQQPDEAKGVALLGSVGTGKTTLLLAVANALLEQKWPVLFMNTSELFAELLQAQWEETGESLEAKIHRIATAKVVIFDDVGKEKVSERVQTQYYRIINQRYNNRLPTCFTSNLSFPELEEKIGDANMSRLYALTRGRQMEIDAGDYRLI